MNTPSPHSTSLGLCWLASSVWLFAAFLPLPSACAQRLDDGALAQIRFDQRLNNQVSLALPFRDEAGRQVRLKEYFGHRPVLLVLGYYQCPMLCTMVLNGLVECAADMKWNIGREFDVLAVSVNPVETAELAAAKKRIYVKRYGRSGAVYGWHFLTGSEAAIRQLAEEVGFRYAYDPESKQYAHPSGLIVLTPDGRISGYEFGVTFSPRHVAESLQRASVRQTGSAIRQFVLLCFHYNPVTGKYSGIVIICLRVLSAATLAGIAWFIFKLTRRARQPQALPANSSSNPSSSAVTADPTRQPSTL